MSRYLALVCCFGLHFAASVHAQPTDPGGQGGDTDPEVERRAEVVARVGTTRITVGMVEDELASQAAFLRERNQTPEAIAEFVQSLIRRELLAQEAERRGLADHEEVARTVQQNMVQELIRRDFDERITPQSITPEAVQTYFDAHPDEFSRPEMARASHIMVDSEEAARALIPQIRDADPRAFGQLARTHSIDQETRLRAGDLRWFTRDGRPPGSRDTPVDPALVEAAFTLTERGDVFPVPIALGENFSVLKLTNRRDAEVRTLSQVEPTIRNRLWREARETAVANLIQELETRFSPQSFPERMRPIRLDVEPPRPGVPGTRPSGGHGHEHGGHDHSHGGHGQGDHEHGGSEEGHGHAH